MNELGVILMAEDNANDVELTRVALTESNLANRLVVVSDGEQALDYLYRRGSFGDRPEGLPAVLLLDLKMPKVDGLEVVRQIKTDPALRRLPVVVLTSSREESDLIHSYDMGVNAFVVKPVEFEKFIFLVRNIGLFWGVLNESPPANVAMARPALQ